MAIYASKCSYLFKNFLLDIRTTSMQTRYTLSRTFSLAPRVQSAALV